MLSVTLKNPVKGDAHRFLSGSTDVFESELSKRFVLAMAALEIEEVLKIMNCGVIHSIIEQKSLV